MKKDNHYFCHATEFKFYPLWGDPEGWQENNWYPLPVETEFGDEMIFSHWDIYELTGEEDDPTSIRPVFKDMIFFFDQALDICQKHNGVKFNEVLLK